MGRSYGYDYTMYALVDCNNFYASCERVFRPDLKGHPVVILSNNDGCIIARSSEAKDLGYAMGAPYFKNRDQLKRDGVAVFSSNYALYGDLSARVMECLEQFAPAVEIYSIDEAFIDVHGIDDLPEFLADLRARVYQWTGIPVSISAARTKTLAKVISRMVKRDPTSNGVGVEADSLEYLKAIPLKDIWGIGRNLEEGLTGRGYETAYDLSIADPRRIRTAYNVVVEKTVRELAGQPCFEFNEAPPHPQNIVVSRGFKHPVSNYNDLQEAVIFYASRAAEKLRQREVFALNITVYIRNNRFQDNHVKESMTVSLPMATQDTREIVKAASGILRKIYRAGIRYQKAGVILTGLHYEHELQTSLFHQAPTKKSDQLMLTLDKLNDKYGYDTIKIASSGSNRKWAMARDLLSPSYTTDIAGIPTAFA